MKAKLTKKDVEEIIKSKPFIWQRTQWNTLVCILDYGAELEIKAKMRGFDVEMNGCLVAFARNLEDAKKAAAEYICELVWRILSDEEDDDEL